MFIRSNVKQKRSSHLQQPIILTEPSTSDYQLWQQNFPSSFNNLNSLADTDITTENNSKNDHSSKNPENDSQSLLER